VSLVVGDDGNGLTGVPGAGLLGLHERALAVGGQLRRTTVPGAGTTVWFDVPARRPGVAGQEVAP
jgi:signal transduction histidine kinase